MKENTLLLVFNILILSFKNNLYNSLKIKVVKFHINNINYIILYHFYLTKIIYYFFIHPKLFIIKVIHLFLMFFNLINL